MKFWAITGSYLSTKQHSAGFTQIMPFHSSFQLLNWHKLLTKYRNFFYSVSSSSSKIQPRNFHLSYVNCNYSNIK